MEELSLRVSSSDRDLAAVFARKHRFEVGLPLSFDEEYGRTTALEHLLGALGADVACGFQVLARKRRLEIDQVEVVVRGRMNNPLAHLGVVGEGGHPGLEHVLLKVYVSSIEDEGELRRVWDEMLRKSPLVCTLRSAFELEIDLKFVM